MQKPVAVVQLCSTPDESASLGRAEQLFHQAVTAGAGLVALPENLAGVWPAEHNLEVAEPLDGPRVERLRGWARQAAVWLLAGSVPEATPGGRRLRNTSLLIDPAGEIVACYRKIHLFDAEVGGRRYRESDRVEEGQELVLADTPWGRAGLSVCYDLRFPELYTALVGQGAELLFVPSAFTRATGGAHWELLVRARAVDGQAFVIAPDQWGEHCPGRHSFGGSMIVDPWGKVLARVNEGEGFALAELDRGRLAEIRQQLPVGEHRRHRRVKMEGAGRV